MKSQGITKPFRLTVGEGGAQESGMMAMARPRVARPQ